MTKEEWFEKATEFSMGICPIYDRPVYIETRGPSRWVVKMDRSQGWVLGKDTEWHWEPLPSSRTDEFLSNTRFSSPDEAYEFWKNNVKERKELYID